MKKDKSKEVVVEVEVEDEEQDDKYEVECLARKIEEVEYAKKKKPEMYSKAVAQLQDKADVISSIDDLSKKRKKLAEEDMES